MPHRFRPTAGFTAVATAAFVVVIGIIIFIVWKLRQPALPTDLPVATSTIPTASSTPSVPANDTPSVPVSETPPPVAEKPKYTDGTYTVDGRYRSPAGTDTMDVTLVITHDIVTSVTITNRATNPTSRLFQDRFAEGISLVVVGKPLDQLTVDVVNGASLTTRGFNNAVTAIKTQAAV